MKALKAAILLGLWLTLLCGWGCREISEPGSRQTLTYTFDAATRDLIRILEERQTPDYQDFDRRYKGLRVPEPILPFEPFVLGLSTQSQIPAVLFLDAPWVQRYGVAGWLLGLENTGIFSREDLAPPVAEAFSATPFEERGRAVKQLVAVPNFIKGNILFYRRDLLKKYGVAPPRTWEELVAACRKILPQERLLRFGLVWHMTNFMNDFYPILWGYGGRVTDAEGRLVLDEPQNLSACLAALRDLKKMQGVLAPAAGDMKLFEGPGALRRAFYRGEVLFMINWNTRFHDLREMISKRQDATHGCLQDLQQVGVAPIPCAAGQKLRYSNIGSFGWGLNRYSVTRERQWVVGMARKFISLVSDERFQLLAAENLGQVPALRRALAKVSNQEVLQVYNEAFAAPDMRLKPRPYSRRLNNVLEREFAEVFHGPRTPEEAVHKALLDLKISGSH